MEIQQGLDGISERAQLANIITIWTQVDLPWWVSDKTSWMSGLAENISFGLWTHLQAGGLVKKREVMGKVSWVAGGESPATHSKTQTTHRCLASATAIRSFRVIRLVLTVIESQASHCPPAVHFTYLIIVCQAHCIPNCNKNSCCLFGPARS